MFLDVVLLLLPPHQRGMRVPFTPHPFDANILIYVLRNSFWLLCGELAQCFTVLAHVENGVGSRGVPKRKLPGGPHL